MFFFVCNGFTNDCVAIFGHYSRQHPLKDQPGFDPRLCYGDIVLSFIYHPDEVQETERTPLPEETLPERPEPSERERSQVDVVIYELKRPHDWTLKRFGQLENCDICHSKVSG